MKKLSIIGSTGSIGTQTLDICRELPEYFRVEALSCGKNIIEFEKQLREFKPKIAAVQDRESYEILKGRIEDLNIELLQGNDGISEVASFEEADTLVAAIVGIAGLSPVFGAIKEGRRICLANKEVLVSGGPLVMEKIKRTKSELLPVDSEHSAIFQSIASDIDNVDKLIITASGGPFRGFNEDELKKVTLAQALRHPNWEMGKKITIDSASLMNKGLEVIEARWLFDIAPENIDVVVHKESIIHSMVQFKDGSVIGQMGLPDMRIPIRYSLSWPERIKSNYERLDFWKLNNLSFEKPDLGTFKCLQLAYEALKDSHGACVVLNGANEAVVKNVLNGKLEFWRIPYVISEVLDKNTIKDPSTIEEIINLDKWARDQVKLILKKD